MPYYTKEIGVEAALKEIEDLPYKDLGFAKIDNHRELRVGYPEVIYCGGKSADQVKAIVEFMLTKDNNILATRASEQMYEAVKKICPSARYNSLGRTITIRQREIELSESYIAIVAAGTSDLAVVEKSRRNGSDSRQPGRENCRCRSRRDSSSVCPYGGYTRGKSADCHCWNGRRTGQGVIGGLVDKPIIAVPTSVGYGASFNGLAALLSMLNSCASGVSVVNIDNGLWCSL